MRDRDTARSAIEAALTGHLVLSTLHTTQASAAPVRLREMGVPAYLIASSLTGVLAQRLIPLRCQTCKGEQCASCYGTGRKGRQVVAELFIPDQQAREAMADSSMTSSGMQEHAVRCGLQPLSAQAQRLVEQGLVWPEDIELLD